MKKPTMEDRKACLLDPYDWELIFTDLHDFCLDDPEAVPSFLAFVVLEPLEAILTAEHGKNGFSGSYTSGLKLLVETRQAIENSTIETAWAVNEAWSAWIKEDLRPKAAMGQKHSQDQRHRASRPRKNTKALIKKALRQTTGGKAAPNKEIWNSLLHVLGDEFGDIEKTGKEMQPLTLAYHYEIDGEPQKPLKYKRFQTVLGEIRKEL